MRIKVISQMEWMALYSIWDRYVINLLNEIGEGPEGKHRFFKTNRLRSNWDNIDILMANASSEDIAVDADMLLALQQTDAEIRACYVDNVAIVSGYENARLAVPACLNDALTKAALETKGKNIWYELHPEVCGWYFCPELVTLQ